MNTNMNKILNAAKTRSLVEIRVFEPAEGGLLPHPDQERYINCWIEDRGGVIHCCMVGGQGWFPFLPADDGLACERWMGKYRATIVDVIDESRRMEGNRIVELDHPF